MGVAHIMAERHRSLLQSFFQLPNFLFQNVFDN